MKLFGCDIRAPEWEDGSSGLMPLVERLMQTPDTCLADGNGNIELHPSPTNPDAISARLDLRNLTDVERNLLHGNPTSASARSGQTAVEHEGFMPVPLRGDSPSSLIEINLPSAPDR